MPAQVVDRIHTFNVNAAFPNNPIGAHDLNSDQAPEIVRLADGDFLILWHAPANTVPDPDRNPGTAFQRFDADGTPDGAGVYLEGYDFQAVAALPDGFVLVAGDEWRVYDGNGIVSGAIGTPSTRGILLDVEPLPDGGWVVSWTREEGPGDYDIYVQTFSAAHVAGTPAIVNTSPVATATQSDLTVFPDGSHAVSWIDGTGVDQVMRIVHGGVEAVIDTAAAVLAGEVAALPDGRMIAAFTQGPSGVVHAAFVAADGTVSTPFLAGDLALTDRAPRIEVFPDGKFLIVWNHGSGGSDAQAYGRVFLPDGTPIDDAPFSIGQVTGGDGYAIAIIDDDDFIVTWTPGPGTLDRTANATFFHVATGEVYTGTPDPDSFTGTNADDTAYGLGAADTLIGLGGDDLLDGGAGADRLEGGAGDDTYHVDDANDVIIELTGVDRVYTTVSYTLETFLSVEYLAALDPAGTAPLVLIGSVHNQEIVGNAGDNLLHGGGGQADVLRGLGGNDVYYTDLSTVQIVEAAGEGNDVLYTSVNYVLAAGVSVETLSTNADVATTPIQLTGNAFAQTIIGNAGNNRLIGGGGADILAGLGGNDDYYLAEAAVQVWENAGGGTDRVYASVSYTLAGGAEVEWLEAGDTGSTAPLSLTGNSYNQTLYGNIGNNVLHGGGGSDVLIGIAGDDIYYTDVATTQVVEVAGGGNDTLYTSVSYTLGGNAQVETLSTNSHAATTSINLVGNLFNQTLVGNAGANILHGAGGTDLLYGFGGNDTYYTDVATTQAFEAVGGGTDALYTSVSYTLAAGQEIELLSTNSHAATVAIDLTGNAFGQTVLGNAGANVLNGGGGNDLLGGFGGADAFLFATALGPGNVDTIHDFSAADDIIQLDDAIFTALGGPGALSADAFVTGTAAADASDRIVYDGATGRLYYDADGNGAGAAVLFATLTGAPALTAADFLVV